MKTVQYLTVVMLMSVTGVPFVSAQERHCERVNQIEICRERLPNGSWGPPTARQRVNTADPNLRPGGAPQNPNHRAPGALR